MLVAALLRTAVAHRGFALGTTFLALLFLLSTAGPWVLRRDPFHQDLSLVLQPPSGQALLGRDELGRDLLARIALGGRYTLGVSVVSVALAITLGIPMGSLAGFYGGLWDGILMRLTDLLLAFPSLLLAIAVVSILGAGLLNLTFAITISAVPGFARLMRGTVLSVKEEEYVHAARVLGASDLRILMLHIVPNALASMIVQATFGVASAILTASGLSFLGLGVQPPIPEWGVMLSRSRGYMRIAPHVILVPGMAIILAIVALNLVGDGLRDLLDPRLRGLRARVRVKAVS